MGISASHPGCLGQRSGRCEGHSQGAPRDPEQEERAAWSLMVPSPPKKVSAAGVESYPAHRKPEDPDRLSHDSPKVRPDSPRARPDSLSHVWLSMGSHVWRESGSVWSWHSLGAREVTEVTETTETIITEITEIIERAGQAGTGTISPIPNTGCQTLGAQPPAPTIQQPTDTSGQRELPTEKELRRESGEPRAERSTKQERDTRPEQEEDSHQQEGDRHQQVGDGHYQEGDGHYQEGDGDQEEGDGHQQDGDGDQQEGYRHQKEGDGQQEEGDGHQKEGDGQQEEGDGHQYVGDGHQQVGDGYQQERDGHQQEADGHQQEGAGDQQVGAGDQQVGDGHQQVGDGHQRVGDGHQQEGDGHQQEGDGHQQEGNGHQQKGYGHQQEAGHQQEGDGYQQVVDGHQQERDGDQQEADGHQQEADGHQQEADGHQQVGDGHQQVEDGDQQVGDGHQEVGDGHQQDGDGYHQERCGHQQEGDGYQQEGDGHQQEGEQLEQLLVELKAKWETLCERATERERDLQEAVLLSGQVSDALCAMIHWLYTVEPLLAEDLLLGGDRESVNKLIENHKLFQKQLGRRSSRVRSLRRCVRELSGSSADSAWLQAQLQELELQWDEVCRLSVCKQVRLQAALTQVGEFHDRVQVFLGTLSEVERTTRFRDFPEQQIELESLHTQHQELVQSLCCCRQEMESIVSLGEAMLLLCAPVSTSDFHTSINIVRSRYKEVEAWAEVQGEQIQSLLLRVSAEQEQQRLRDWIREANEKLNLSDQEPLPEHNAQLEERIAEHTEFLDELMRKKSEVEKEVETQPRRGSSVQTVVRAQRGNNKSVCASPDGRKVPTPMPLEAGSGPGSRLLTAWHQLWVRALDREEKLQEHWERLQERADFEHFDFSSWRCRYMQWIADRKCRLLDVFRSIDREQHGLVSREHFIHNVLTSKFPTNSLEMAVVADVFDLNADGFIDYWDFTSVLHPSRDALRLRDSHAIHDEVSRQVAQCNCVKRFLVERISANRYRFGNSQRMRMVRVLRCTVMVRVGGGWSALDEFLVKNDPCRVKGRTNIKLKERYLTPEGNGTPTSQAATSTPTWSSVRTPSSCMSAPSSPRTRKSIVRRSRSGDRSQSNPQSRNSFTLEEVDFTVYTASTCCLAASDVSQSVVEEAGDPPIRDSTSGCDQQLTDNLPGISDKPQ